MDYWIVACAAGTLLSRVGLALYACGLVRAKNAGSTLLRHFADFALSALAFWAVGMAVANLGGRSSNVINLSALFGLGGDAAVIFGSHAFLLLSVSLLSSGIVVGSLAERSRFWPSIAPAVLLGGIVTPLLARWTGIGWLGSRLGFHDCAGGSFVHLAAGTCAAVAAIIVGPRSGKYNRDGSSNVIPGHSLPLAASGAMLLVAAWVPYVLSFVGVVFVASRAGIGMTATNVILSAAAAGLTSLAMGHWRYGKPDISLTLTGMLGGLAAITAGADVLGNIGAVATGAVAGAVVPWFVLQIEMVWRVDDPTGAVATHGVGGAWGLLATALFAHTETLAAKAKLLGAELTGLLVVVAMVSSATAVMFLVLKRLTPLRAREADEFDGLDLAEHDIGSYPDFQQNTIKSYHLREA